MTDVILYVDVSDVREGALEELQRGMKRLVEFVEANEPRLIAYNVYFSTDGSRMTVASVHPDSASVEYHLTVAGPLFREFVDAGHAVLDPHLRGAQPEGGRGGPRESTVAGAGHGRGEAPVCRVQPSRVPG